MTVFAQKNTYSDKGAEILEYMEEARNYNQCIEDKIFSALKSAKHIVDFGAGAGEFAKRFSARGLHVSCVELDPNLSSKLKSSGFEVKTDLLSYSGIDCIYSVNVLEHIEHDDLILETMYKVLPPKGCLILYVPAFNFLYTEMDALVGHHRRYAQKSLVEKCTDAGFDIQSVEYVDSLGFVFLGLLKLLGLAEGGTFNIKTVKFYDKFFFPMSRLMDQLFQRFFGKNIFLVAQKK